MVDRSQSSSTDPSWPSGTVTGLIGGPLMTPATSRALVDRLAVSPPSTAVFDSEQLTTLAAMAARLLPQDGRAMPIDLAGELNRRLANNAGDGWRFAALPADAAAHQRGLDATDAAASSRHGKRFPQLLPAEQDALLRDIQFRNISGADWEGFDSALWFVDLLAVLVDIDYSHPVAQEEIGYLGMADARGWQDVGFGARAPHEPEPLAASRV